MTNAELLGVLARECPNGVSFDPMAVRLLSQRVRFEDGQIEELKSVMFQLGNGLFFSREMISDEETGLAFEGQALDWLEEYGCFSVARLFENFCGALRHIDNPEVCASFLQYLGFSVAVKGKGGCFCFQSPPGLDDCLAAISKTLVEWFEEADGTLTCNEIEQAMPHLTAEALDSILIHFLPEVHRAEVGGVPCWRSTESITLPEDFSEKLTTIVDTLVSLEEKVTSKNLEFALDLFYCMRFRKEYFLLDSDVFMRVCAKHYQGGHDVFPDSKGLRIRDADSVGKGKRVRSPNTRFHSLGVPHGAKLVFTKNNNITCVVLDDVNQVEYAGAAWSISSLAMHLLGVSSANGFCYFSYDGEILWERRLRLCSSCKSIESVKASTIQQSIAQKSKCQIIGLEGRTLSPTTWRAFRSAGTSPRVADWARRVERGEVVESIALETGLTSLTVKEYILNRRRYLDVCRINGIVPEADTNV